MATKKKAEQRQKPPAKKRTRKKVAAPTPESVSAGPPPVEPIKQQRESPIGRRVKVEHGGQRHDGVVVGEAPGLVVQLRDGPDPTELFVRASEVR